MPILPPRAMFPRKPLLESPPFSPISPSLPLPISNLPFWFLHLQLLQAHRHSFSYSCPNCEFDLHVHCAYNIMPQTTTPMSYPSLSLQPNFNPQFAKPNDTGKKPPRRVKHFSHDHPLHLAELREGDKIICSGCQNGLSGSGYRCSKIPSCKFYLHKACFELPREIRHKSHHYPDHPLALPCSPPCKEDGVFTCNACLSSGTAFRYHCSACNFDLHVKCAFLPETVKSGDHHHPLSLLRSFPFEKTEYDENVIFVCDVCGDAVDFQRCWFYYCRECEYGAHLDCATAKAPPKEGESSGDLLSAALLELQMLELQSKLSKLNADFHLNSSAETINQLGHIG